MKKKIKDLTKEDVEKICNHQIKQHDSCRYCPLRVSHKLHCLQHFFMVTKYKTIGEFVERKVELNEQKEIQDHA